ncbi:hypothetical protein EGW08_008210 [Elysia chlorotica]|uniref:Sodium-dependent multivitamin transporter n=1 Tax=Elysia chlorotica TaxID=188477 RepID=A0A433TQX7_ELYCH|nr:hypothetical protein EGW08_008210 [Elysia chlorotica]
MSSPSEAIQFQAADFVFLALMLGGSMVIGLYIAARRRQTQTREDYLLGGRHMSAIPVCLSLFATFQSAISLLGIPTEVYTHGTMILYSQLGLVLSYYLALLTVVPLMYPLRLTSVYEYLRLRYRSRLPQLVGSAMGMVTNLSYMTVALLSPALALETAVGIPLWMSIVLVGAIGTAYTSLGGMRSVIWTDVFQTAVIFAGIFTVLVKGTMDVGGPTKVWQIGLAGGRVRFDETSLDPRVRHTVWNQMVGSVFFWLAVHFNQSSVQRVMSTRAKREANRVYLLTIPIVTTYSIVMMATGLVILAYFFSLGCDPLAAGSIHNKNQLVPYFVLHALRFLPGLPGLYISTIFSGALSTLSSGINSLSANMVEDFLAGPLRHRSESAVTTITKLLVCCFGLLIIGLAYLAKEFQGPITQITYTFIGASSGPALGLFLLSGLFPQANSPGALAGLGAGFLYSVWQAVGASLFGQSNPGLPLGPTDRCVAANSTAYDLTTAGYGFTSKLPDLYTSPWSQSVTTAATTATGAGFQDRDFSLYDLSYTLNPVFGAVITVVVGLSLSLVLRPCLGEVQSPEAKLLFPFCRRFWYSDRDVLSTEMKPREKDIGRDLGEI